MGNNAAGIYKDMPFDEYLAIPAMSASKIKSLYKSYRDYEKGLKQTPSMASGRIEHLAVLEQQRFLETIVITPETRITEKDKEVKFVRSGVHWENFQNDNIGKTIITSKENEQCVEVAHAVAENPHATKYLTGEKEVSIFWDDPLWGLSKMRCDCLNEKWICDLKRTASKLLNFGWVCDDLGYDVQSAWYLRGAKAAGLSVETFIFVAYESAYPHDSTCQEVTFGMIETGLEKIEIAHENLLRGESRPAEFHGKFPGLVSVDFPVKFEGDE